MKNKRQKAKEQTLSKIVEVTRQLIAEKGLLKLSTLEIANKAQIAHGTIFFHFKDKNSLFIEAINTECIRIAKELRSLIDRKKELKELLTGYFHLLSKNEVFFVALAKEFPFYDPEIQKNIISVETIIKNMIFQKVEQGIQSGIYKKTDSTMVISYLFGTINYYLSRKQYFTTGKNSVLQLKMNNIIDTFFLFIKI